MKETRSVNSTSYQNLCTVILGVATLFRFVGYDIATFIAESLIHSAHIRDPSAIVKHAGFYGQGVKEISTCLSTLVVPIILNYCSPKWTLVIGCSLFAVYYASILFIMIYTSFYTCQINFSTRETLARNSARIQGISCLSMIFSGLLYIYITSSESTADINEKYRFYSKSETSIICAFLLGFCLVNIMLTCFLPSRKIENCVSSPEQKLQIGSQLKESALVLIHPEILLFIPRFLNHGFLISFQMSVYPTSLQYSTVLSKKYPMMTAYYAFAMCTGTSLCGIVISPLSKYFNDFGFRPLFNMAAGTQLIACFIAAFTVPNWSTAMPTEDIAMLEPKVLPGRSSHTYSAARFYRGVAASAIFFGSPFLSMTSHAIILVSITVISSVSFNFAVNKLEKRDEERILSECPV